MRFGREVSRKPHPSGEQLQSGAGEEGQKDGTHTEKNLSQVRSSWRASETRRGRGRGVAPAPPVSSIAAHGGGQGWALHCSGGCRFPPSRLEEGGKKGGNV